MLTSDTVHLFPSQFFHPDHATDISQHAVMLSPELPSHSMMALLQDPHISHFLTYLQVSLLSYAYDLI